MKSVFMERFARQVQTRDVDRVSSGFAAQLRLTFQSGANVPKAAVILSRRHLPLAQAHSVLTEMVDNGSVVLTVPCVENIDTLKQELHMVGIVAVLSDSQSLEKKMYGMQLDQPNYSRKIV